MLLSDLGVTVICSSLLDVVTVKHLVGLSAGQIKYVEPYTGAVNGVVEGLVVPPVVSSVMRLTDLYVAH